jgi:hypothetical protein
MAGLTGCESNLDLPIRRNPAERAALRSIVSSATRAKFLRDPKAPAHNSGWRGGQPFRLTAARISIFELQRPAVVLRRSDHLRGLSNSFSVEHAASEIKRWRMAAIQRRLKSNNFPTPPNSSAG